jgi:hypothetical protein
LEYLSDDVLDILLRDRHLLRAEQNSTGGSSLEISHDTLVAPILRARTVRQARMAEAARIAEELRLLSELEREQAARAKARRQLWRTRVFLVIALLGVVAASAASYYAMKQKKIADRLAESAAQSEAETIRQGQINDSLRVENEKNALAEREKNLMEISQLQKDAESYAMYGEKQYAIEKLQEALILDSTRVDIKKRIEELE